MTGIKKMTLVHWLDGDVERPQKWQPLLKLAAVLHFSKSEVNELLSSAGKPSIAKLWDTVTEEVDKKLIAPWPLPNVPFRANDDIHDFTGQEAEITRLEEWLSQDQFFGPLRLSGMPGIGKTVLAAHIANKVKSEFPDGVLWENMDGVDLMNTLSTFAADLGHDLNSYRGLGSRSRAFKDILARKRVLIILDNAFNYADADPFLPRTPSTSAVIITTRHRDLGISLSTYPLHLDQFSPMEAEELFSKILGEERVREEDDYLAEVARYLGYLPIALNIAAYQIENRPGSTAANFLTRLQQAENRLAHLVDKDRNVQALFETSYEQLKHKPDAAVQRFFTALCAFSGRDFDAKAAAHVTGLPELRTEDLLYELRDMSLLQEIRSQRFRLHDLLHDFAREKNKDEHVYVQMAEYYIAFAVEHEQNYEAISLESANIVGALEITRDLQLDNELVRGVDALDYYWDTRGLYEQAVTWLKRSETVARNQGDNPALVRVLNELGLFERRQGNTGAAERYFQEGLVLARLINNKPLVAIILDRFGILLERAGKFKQAEAYYLESLALFREIGDLLEMSKLLLGLGGLASDMGHQKTAVTYLQEALEIARNLDDLDIMGTIYNNLGAVAGRQGDYKTEEACYEEALAMARQTQNQLDICFRLCNLGELANVKGNHEKAQAYLEEALEIALGIEHRERTGTSFRLMGEVAIALDDYVEAESLLRQGLAYIEGSNLPVCEGALLANLGMVMISHEDYVQSKTCFDESLALLREAGQTWYLADALNKQGELYLKQERIQLASDIFDEALEISRDAEFIESVAGALFGKGRVAAMSGNIALARDLGQESLALCEDIGYYKAGKIRAWLLEIQDRH